MKTGLVIVAHPDDETIWMGGTLLAEEDTKWTILSLCRKNDKDRAPKFKKVCRCYNATGIISDLEDEGIMNIKKSLPEIERRILKEIKKKNFTYIFTHGYNGEYGHPRHIGVHKTVKGLVEKKVLKCDKLFFFAYKLNPQKRVVNRAEKSAGMVLNLRKKTLKEKKDIVKKLYGFSKNSFENRSCLAKETFYENINSIRASE
jgi:LmbE family N-acetylglucosaminyl deacetylase